MPPFDAMLFHPSVYQSFSIWCFQHMIQLLFFHVERCLFFLFKFCLQQICCMWQMLDNKFVHLFSDAAEFLIGKPKINTFAATHFTCQHHLKRRHCSLFLFSKTVFTKSCLLQKAPKVIYISEKSISVKRVG